MIFFIPLGDDNRDRRRTPFVTWTLLVVNVLVFAVLQGCGTNADFTMAYSTVPAEIVTGRDVVTEDRTIRDPASGERFVLPGLKPTPIPVWLTLLTAMFMHGGLAHLGGNMLFLGVFGDNVEDDLGHARFVVFYLLTGLVGSLAHVATTVVTDQDVLTPSLGASGAISGVLGGYLLLHPHRRVRVLLGYVVTEVPAVFAIGLWFAFQLVAGLGMLGAGSRVGGVAYAAHVGGFVAGLALVKLFLPKGPERPEQPGGRRRRPARPVRVVRRPPHARWG